jgi:hypothetical protein
MKTQGRTGGNRTAASATGSKKWTRKSIRLRQADLEGQRRSPLGGASARTTILRMMAAIANLAFWRYEIKGLRLLTWQGTFF